MEVDGHLYVLTQGSGVNRYQNEPVVDGTTAVPFIGPTVAAGKAIRRVGASYGNDNYGAMAFRQLDSELFSDVQRIRNGKPLPPVDILPEKMPPAILFNNPKRGRE